MVHPTFQLADITLDCRDPAVVGAFWSKLLGARLRVRCEGWVRLEYDEGTVMVMADPEGNEFCLVQRPLPATPRASPQ